MTALNIELLIPNIVIEDKKLSNTNTFISQITILTIKSLIPMEDKVGNVIDYKRFTEELNLWKSYSIGENKSLLNALNPSKSEYFTYFDESYYTRLLPIIISNVDYEVIEEEIIKNILYFSGNTQNLLEWLLIGFIIYLLLEGKSDIKEYVKEYLINFSQVDFLEKYNTFFRVKVENIALYKVSFERERVCILNVLNGIKNKEYGNLQDILDIVDGQNPYTTIGNIVYKSLKETDTHTIDMFYLNMNKYILKLRKGRINIEDLRIEEYILPDIFSFNEGDIFFHSLLNHSKVIKKEANASGSTSLISTKTGNYLFRRDPL